MFEDTEDYGTTLKAKDENIRMVIARNKIDQAVYVGDTVMDHKSAAKAGVPFIHCHFGFGRVEGVPGVDTFFQLPEVIASILE